MHPDVGAAYVSLANLAIIRHAPNEAIDWYRTALEVFEASGPSHGPNSINAASPVIMRLVEAIGAGPPAVYSSVRATV